MSKLEEDKVKAEDIRTKHQGVYIQLKEKEEKDYKEKNRNIYKKYFGHHMKVLKTEIMRNWTVCRKILEMESSCKKKSNC